MVTQLCICLMRAHVKAIIKIRHHVTAPCVTTLVIAPSPLSPFWVDGLRRMPTSGRLRVVPSPAEATLLQLLAKDFLRAGSRPLFLRSRSMGEKAHREGSIEVVTRFTLALLFSRNWAIKSLTSAKYSSVASVTLFGRRRPLACQSRQPSIIQRQHGGPLRG